MRRSYNPSLPIRDGRYEHVKSHRVGVVTSVLCAGPRNRRYRYVMLEIVDSLGVTTWKSSVDIFWREWRSYVPS